MWRAACLIMVVVSHPRLAVADDPLRFRGACMGTTYAVTIADSIEKSSLQLITERVADEFERIEQIFSLYRPDSRA